MSPTQEGDVPNPRHLAVIYFCFYSATSLLVTFWPHYMTSLGMDSADIGIVFGVGTIVGIFAQPTLTALSDYVGRPGRALQVLSIATLALMLGIPFVTGFLGMAILLWVSAIPRSAIVPLLDATTIRSFGDARYGTLRVWGSLGYGATAAVFGLMAQDLPYETAGTYSVWAYLALAAVVSLLTLGLPPDRPSVHRPDRMALLTLAKNPRLLFFFGVQALHWAGVMYFNVYLSIHTRSLEMGIAVPSFAIFVSIAAEIAAFWVARPFITGHRARWALVVVMGTSAARWLVMSMTEDAWLIIAIQVIHFFSFGVWYAACVVRLSDFGPPAQRGALQGLFAAMVFGVGGGTGSMVGGEIVHNWGTSTGFVAAACLETLALTITLAIAVYTQREST